MFKTLLAIVGGCVIVYQAAKAWHGYCMRTAKAAAYDDIQAAKAAAATPPAGA